MDNNVLVSNIGTYDSTKGTINITSFYTDDLFAVVKLSAVPANPSTLRPLRNHIFELDTEVSTVTAVIDDGNIKVSL
jgi:predicted Kef-type K+ transport protein